MDYIGKIKESSDTKLKKIYRPERHIEIMRAINSREKGQLSLNYIFPKEIQSLACLFLIVLRVLYQN